MVRCSIPTENYQEQTPVLFEPRPSLSLPEGLEISESILSLQGTSCSFNIPVTYTSNSTVVIPPKTILGSLQLPQSVTPLDATFTPFGSSVDKATVSQVTVPGSNESDKQFVHSESKEVCDAGISSTPCDDWLPPVDVSHLPVEKRKLVEDVLREENSTFFREKLDLGDIPEVQMEINLTDEQPVQRRYNSLHRPLYPEVKAYIQDLLNGKLITKSTSPFSSPIVAARKKDGSLRMCIDYRALNAKTIPDRYPLQKIKDVIDNLSGKKFFSLLDQSSAYHQA